MDPRETFVPCVYVSLAEGGGERDDRDEIASNDAKSSSAESIHMPQQPSIGTNTGQNTPVQPRTASIRSRPTSSRITAAELEVTISHPLAARAPDMLPLSFSRSITESIRGARCPRIEWHCYARDETEASASTFNFSSRNYFSDSRVAPAVSTARP